jgi:hypothetical protein
MTATFAKLGLLFVGGMALGLAVPWGFGPSKPADNSDQARAPGERTVTVRCIVECRGKRTDPNRLGGRRLPPLDDPMLPQGEITRPVEVRVKPNPAKATSGSDDVTIILNLNSCCSSDAENPEPERPMPDAM